MGCATAVALPEHPVAIAYMQQTNLFNCPGAVGVVIHNFDTFLDSYGLEATDATLQNPIDVGLPSLHLERTAGVESKQSNPRYPPTRL